MRTIAAVGGCHDRARLHGLLVILLDTEAEPAQELPDRRLTAAEFTGGQRVLPRQEALRDANDRLRVVALAVVDQNVPASMVEAVLVQECFLAKLVVLVDRTENRVAGDVPESHG